MATGGGKKADGEVINRLTCSVCLEPYRQLKLLPCFHTFCTPCLQQLVDAASRFKPRTEQAEENADRDKDGARLKTDDRDGSSFQCPTCHKPVAIPPGGVAEFQSNFYLDEEMSAHTTMTYCDVCEENPATHFCLDCQQNFCRACRAVHGKVTSSKSHQVEPVVKGEERQPAQSTPDTRKGYCQTHTDQKLVFYCHQCQAAICLYCKLTSHEGHTTEDVALAAERIRAEVHQLSFDLDRQIEVTDKVIMKVTEEQKALLQQKQDVLDKAKASADKLAAWMKEAQDKLSDQVERISDPIGKQLQSQLNQAMRTKSVLTDLQKRTKVTLEKGTHADFIYMMTELKVHSDKRHRTEFKDTLEGAKSYFFHQVTDKTITQQVVSQFVGEVLPENKRGVDITNRVQGEAGKTLSCLSSLKLPLENFLTLTFLDGGKILACTSTWKKISGNYIDYTRLTVISSESTVTESSEVAGTVVSAGFMLSERIFVIVSHEQELLTGLSIQKLQPVSVSFDILALSRSKPGSKLYCLARPSSRLLEVHSFTVDPTGNVSTESVCKFMFRGDDQHVHAFDVSAEAQCFAVLCSWSSSKYIHLYSLPEGQHLFTFSDKQVKDICFSTFSGKEMLYMMSPSCIDVLDCTVNYRKISVYTQLKEPTYFVVGSNCRIGMGYTKSGNYPAEIIFPPQ